MGLVIKDLVGMYSDVEKIVLVLDNLSTHIGVIQYYRFLPPNTRHNPICHPLLRLDGMSDLNAKAPCVTSDPLIRWQ